MSSSNSKRDMFLFGKSTDNNNIIPSPDADRQSSSPSPSPTTVTAATTSTPPPPHSSSSSSSLSPVIMKSTNDIDISSGGGVYGGYISVGDGESSSGVGSILSSSSPPPPPPRYLETFPNSNINNLNHKNKSNNNHRYLDQTIDSNHHHHHHDDENQSLIDKCEQPKIVESSSRQNGRLYSSQPPLSNKSNDWIFEKNNNNVMSTDFESSKNNNNDPIIHRSKQQSTKDNVELIWRNLSYTISRFQWKTFLKEKGRGYKHKTLLNSISGSMRAGELMAIMGPSGAGKTTMIECISGRRRRGVSGDIVVANCTKRTKLAYMAQEDAFMPCLTVYETLLFASKLRNYQRNNRCRVKLVDDNENVYNATTLPDSDLVISLPDGTYHRNLVNQILQKLGLDQCRNVKAENCSGGQQKRLCIALELIHSPTILILDEPTSGLDSVSCLQCVSLLRELAHNAEQPMAIAASIHQPTARILQNFDRLYVLAFNGQCMYDGPTNQLVSYLSRYKLSCPTYHNPADFVLEVASGDYGHDVIKQLINDQNIQHQKGCLKIKFPTETTINGSLTMDSNLKTKDSTVVNVDDVSDDNNIEIAMINSKRASISDDVRLWPENAVTVSINKICQRSRKQVKRREFYKTMLLWMRCMLLSFRDPTEYLLRIFATVSIILLNIVLYNDSKMGQADGCSQDTIMHMVNTIRSDYDGNQTFSLANSLLEGPGALAILNFGYIFFAMTFCSFLSMMPTILTFPLEVGVFYKEYFNGWYSFSSYFLAKNLTNLLPTILLPILYGSTTYMITNQYFETWRFLYFIALVVMISLVADGIGLTISAIFVHNVNAASIFAATSQIPLLLFTGFLVQIDQLPRIIQPLTYLSFYRLFFESTVITFYGFNRCPEPEPFDLKRVRELMGDDAEEMMDCVWQNTNFFDSSSGPSLTDRLERILSASENQNPSLILQNFRLNEKDLPFLMCLLGSYAIIARIIAYIVLYRKANSRR
uniref:ATP-binding cassette sub-family G member 1-like isoform X2 n=1 Tax=Dermatophagoides pteronyssinus TaxID=6956 RepID=A0A6P6XRB0_DERPT|nr:ATP-binding cassette sub-family G member 1-like isoform X2 [Dermatophagoides pteronyssinus]